METLEQIAWNAASVNIRNNNSPEELAEFSISLLAKLSNNGVLISIRIPEGYEDVHPTLIADDAMKNSQFIYDAITGA